MKSRRKPFSPPGAPRSSPRSTMPLSTPPCMMPPLPSMAASSLITSSSPTLPALRVAAVATAAHDVLVALFPAQQAALDTAYQEYLTANGLSATDPGVTVGTDTLRRAFLALRANDGRFPPNPPPFTGGTDPGVWRPTPSYLPGPPPAFAPGAAPWVATVTPFTLESPSQFRADPPPSLTSKSVSQRLQRSQSRRRVEQQHPHARTNRHWLFLGR